jgi:hypothetical protein
MDNNGRLTNAEFIQACELFFGSNIFNVKETQEELQDENR